MLTRLENYIGDTMHVKFRKAQLEDACLEKIDYHQNCIERIRQKWIKQQILYPKTKGYLWWKTTVPRTLKQIEADWLIPDQLFGYTPQNVEAGYHIAAVNRITRIRQLANKADSITLGFEDLRLLGLV